MTDHFGAKVAAQIDALNGDAPTAAVLELATQGAHLEIRQAVARWEKRARPCREGDDLAVQLDHEDGCRGEHSPASNPACWQAPVVAHG